MARKKKAMSKEERTTALFKNIKLLDGTKDFTSSYILAIDPGRTQPGMVTLNPINSHNRNLEIQSLRPKLKGFSKVIEVEIWVRDMIKSFKDRHMPLVCFMEDYSFESEFGREKAGEMQGVILRLLWYNEIPVFKIAPSQVKAFIGVTSKELIIKEVLRKYKIDTKNSDEADAVVLGMMGIAVRRIVVDGMNIDEKDRGKFETHPHRFSGINEKEAKTASRVIMMKGEEAHGFARGKEIAKNTYAKAHKKARNQKAK
jgi:Holliday junction resolvasome RuvABC endonuclease subunit